MGLTLGQITSGIVDVGNVVNQSLQTWGQLSGKQTIVAPTPAPQPAAPAAPTTGNLAQNPAGGLNIPTWALLGGGAVLIWMLARRKR